MIPLVYAHRGASGLYPENTMEAFHGALKRRADGLELDVQLSRDGKVVVIHDHRLERTTNGTGTVQQHTWRQLRRLRADKGARPPTSQTRIPSLKEVLDAFAPTPLRFIIELKNFLVPQPHLEERVIDLIKRYQLTERTVVSSFNFDSLLRIKELEPSQATALLYVGPLQQPWEVGARYGTNQLHVPDDQLTRPLVEEAKARGFQVLGWAIDKSARIRQAAEMGVDGIITNYPGKARKVLRRS